MSRRLTEVLRYARELGYEDRGQTRGDHHRLWHPAAERTVFVASTPSSSALANIKPMLRRLAKRRPTGEQPCPKS